jgi:hypothetical protein
VAVRRPLEIAHQRLVCSVLFVVIAGSAFLAGCDKRQSDQPPRPVGVPENAFWVGGADGGVFIILEKQSGDASGVYQGTIYHDSSGRIWYRGRLIVEPKGNAIVDITNPKLFDGWDGRYLHLIDGRRMEASK